MRLMVPARRLLDAIHHKGGRFLSGDSPHTANPKPDSTQSRRRLVGTEPKLAPCRAPVRANISALGAFLHNRRFFRFLPSGLRNIGKTFGLRVIRRVGSSIPALNALALSHRPTARKPLCEHFRNGAKCCPLVYSG